MRWRQLELAAPDVAALGRARFEASGLALLGTLRRDGWPRISPVEPFFAAEDLLLGLMSRSGKAGDVREDPRCVLQSVVTEPNAGETEVKLYGRLAEVVDPVMRGARQDAWWVSRPPDAALVVTVLVERAVVVEWGLERGEMTLTTWSPDRGARVVTRAYP